MALLFSDRVPYSAIVDRPPLRLPDNARVAVWVIGLVVVVLLALAGLVFVSQYNVLAQLDLPRIPVDEGTATTAGIISLVAVLIATLVGAIVGGSLGARYHRKVDRGGLGR